MGALGAASSAPVADEFMYRGFRLLWRGWIEPVNQNVSIGVWWAINEETDKCYAGTTLGVAERVHNEMDCIDTTRMRDWPIVNAFSTAAERAAAKERGRLNLLKAIDDGEPVANV